MPPVSLFLFQGTGRLQFGPHPQRARPDAEFLLMHVLQRDRAWLMAHFNDEIESSHLTAYHELLQRRHRGEPIQHITGEQEFYGLPIRVTPDVLIPRPETEHLVEKALELAATLNGSLANGSVSAHDLNTAERISSVTGHDFSRAETSTREGRASAPANSAFPRILDVGTGSGAIAIALAHHLPRAQITALDISERALETARENAQRNGVFDRIRFLESDLLAAVSSERFDLVVSNPPYVPAADRATLSVEVREYEPALALFAGDDGLDIYHRLIPQAFDVLEPQGSLLMEVGFGQSAQVAFLLNQAGFEQIEFVPDLQGIPRVACAVRR